MFRPMKFPETATCKLKWIYEEIYVDILIHPEGFLCYW